MANDLNRCEFIGRLGADPEVRYAQNGNAIVNMRIAVGRAWKDKQTGEKQESTEWVPLVVFGKLAEICAQYLAKGAQIFVAGEFRTRKWQDRDGNDRYTTEVVVSDMQMLGGKSSDNATQQAPRQRPAPSQQGATRDAPEFDEDIPFAPYFAGW